MSLPSNCAMFIFSSFQFNLFNSIKSITSLRDPPDIQLVIIPLSDTIHKNSVHKVTIIIPAGNKISLIYRLLIDWFNWYDWSIHFCVHIYYTILLHTFWPSSGSYNLDQHVQCIWQCVIYHFQTIYIYIV
jgi:hypothetical protein